LAEDLDALRAEIAELRKAVEAPPAEGGGWGAYLAPAVTLLTALLGIAASVVAARGEIEKLRLQAEHSIQQAAQQQVHSVERITIEQTRTLEREVRFELV
jgi:hypothetical protein